MASTDKVHFNLDTVERRPEETFDVFATVIEGRRIEITDPAEIDYQDLLGCDSPLEFLRFTMTEEDREYLRSTRIKGWRLGKLIEAYLAHYKAEERMDKKKLGF